MYWKLILKIPRFLPLQNVLKTEILKSLRFILFRANMTQFGTHFDTLAQRQITGRPSLSLARYVLVVSFYSTYFSCSDFCDLGVEKCLLLLIEFLCLRLPRQFVSVIISTPLMWPLISGLAKTKGSGIVSINLILFPGIYISPQHLRLLQIRVIGNHFSSS